MLTLGLSTAYRDSSACLIENGCLVGAAEESGFYHVRNSRRLTPFLAYEIPYEAIAWCLTKHKARLSDVDHIAYAWDPALFSAPIHPATILTLALCPIPKFSDSYSLWGELFLNHIANAPVHLAFGYPEHLSHIFAGPTHFIWHFVSHQTAHMASAYLGSPFDDAAILCLDTRGERASTSYAVGRGSEICPIGEVLMPQSLGLFYEKITEHLGFLGGSDEGKVMALAAYGKPRFRRAFEELITTADGGQYRTDYENLAALLGPKRQAREPIDTRHKDIACSLQEALNETVLTLARWLRQQTQSHALTLAGSLTLNCILNSALRDAGLFDEVWVQPARGASGPALGAALVINHATTVSQPRYRLAPTCLGPQFSSEEIEEALIHSHLPFGRPPAIAVAVAARLASGKVVAWFQGGTEFSPYTLGSRSILASPCDPSMADRLNQLKDREAFQPIASATLIESAGDWFEDARLSPFMSFVSPIREDKRPRIPAAMHIDGTARVQAVDRAVQPLFHDVIEAFGALTGVPVLLTTSFKTRDRPGVRTPADAIERYASSPVDVLALGPFLLEKLR